MTDDNTDDEIEMTDEEIEDMTLEERAEEALQQANQMHQQIAQFKEWSVETAADIRSRAELLHELDEISEEERDELQTQAQQVRTVYQRLDMG